MTSNEINSVLIETRKFPAPAKFTARARIKPADLEALYKQAADDHEGFWAQQAKETLVVVRGADLLDSTPRQIYLQQQLGYAQPSYLHLPLVVDDNNQKLGRFVVVLSRASLRRARLL